MMTNNYVGAKYAVAVSNATAGLHIAVLALGLKEKQRVRFLYGVSEKQFRALFVEAKRREGKSFDEQLFFQ